VSALDAADPDLVDAISERLDAVRVRITRAGGDHVTIVGVTKRHPIGVIHAAMAAGIGDLGENYAQELVEKSDQLTGDRPRFHFIGQLQTNKVRLVAPLASVIQTVDRPALVEALVRRAAGATVMIQVDLAGIIGRGGCAFDDAPGLVALASGAGLNVSGLMGVAVPARSDADRVVARRSFERLRGLADELSLAEVSMGMSDDLEEAVGAGSTMVRVGSALFGPRM
jgi:pyridoxal phosphate enzyme (YggS family)